MNEDPKLAGIGVTDAQKTRIADIHARLRTHGQAVNEAQATLGSEPEIIEYTARWRAFRDEMNALGERAASAFSWITDSELNEDDKRLNLLIDEWPLLKSRIELRLRTKVNSLLQGAVTEAAKKNAAGTAVSSGAPMSPIVIPDLTVDLPDSAVTKAPPGPSSKPGDPNMLPKAAALGALGLGTLVGIASAKGDAARAGIAAGGAALLGLGVWFLFKPSAPVSTDPKLAGVPPTQRRHAHTCSECGHVFWHDPGPCMAGTGSPAACTIAHVCENCGHVERHVDTSICGTEEP